ncbi:MAG TPA: methyltransferase domain-containing protein [Candidatus Omnitrophota bacterium]|nr:methyltransferase domain-containing protein [Candidatus Omnitrophota bacterium]HPM42510.1 methyltransferase domain-containing protein [Candidatus Omnitrophota bacterium]
MNIKKMKLYRHPDRIFSELGALGYKDGMPLKPEEVARFDQYHYFGTDAVDDAINALKVDHGKNIIEIGSGIGGPARYLAMKTGCHVTAVEIQPDLNDIAVSLTARCGLSDLVSHIPCDILRLPDKYSGFDCIVSWLSFLHIPDRRDLFKKCYDILKPGGQILIEDFYKRGEFSEEELKVLSEDTYCTYLPDAGEYKEQLAVGGFSDIELTDKTDSWREYVKSRREKFIKDRERNIRIHNLSVINDLEDFYTKMSRLFMGTNVGGLRIIAKKSG